MSKKTQIVSVTKTVQSPAARPSKTRRRKNARVNGVMSPKWLSSILHPFDHEPTGIPDDQTSPSLKFTTRDAFALPSTAAVSAINHGLAIGISPYLSSTTSAPTGVVDWISKYSNFDAVGQVFTGPIVGVQTNPINMTAMMPPFSQGGSSSDRGYHYRLTALGVRVGYLGRESERSGEIFIGLAQSSNQLGASTSDNLNAWSMTYGQTATAMGNMSLTTIKNRMKRLSFHRSEDGVCEALWIPMGAPKYRPLASLNSTCGDIHDDASPQLFVVIHNDLTSGSTTTGATYRFEIVAHWEIVPQSRVVLAAQPTPSPSDPLALASCLNGLALVPSALSAYGGSFDDGRQASTGSAWESARGAISNVGNHVSNAFLNLSNNSQMRDIVGRSVAQGAMLLARDRMARNGRQRLNAPVEYVD